ncbi:hypothetical protein HUJ05_004437 [Dendroctonus ponderosae]|nr:hypothetical protein HUJ05_004437 [Dendroctonus ponderosae]
MSSVDLPFRAEYSKSSRAKCKGCKQPIEQAVLRMATLTQSPFHDGKQANWFHFDCFFTKRKINTTDDIDNFESLRIEDQDRIKANVGALAAIVPDAKAKGRKRPADKEATKAKKLALKDYTIQYAKSSRSVCRGCEQKIMKDDIRVSKKEHDSDVSRQVGGIDQWHHLTCFAQLRSELGFFESADKIPGFQGLSKEDQTQAKKTIPAIKQEDIPEIKKIKIEDDPLDEEYREQNKIMFNFRDQLKEVPKNELRLLLQSNNQEIPEGLESLYDRISDIMTFGALQPCKECKDGQLIFGKAGYTCTGNLSEWAKCTVVTKEPERTKFVVPKQLKESHPFLKKYRYVARKRVIKDAKPSVSVKKEAKDEVDGPPKVTRALPALYEMEFVILGHPKRGKDVLKKNILALGGKVVTRIHETNMAIIADVEMVEKMGVKMQQARDEEVHIVSEDFVDEAKNNAGKIPELIIKKCICSWGSDPKEKLPIPSSKSALKSKSRFTSNVPSKITLKLKGESYFQK